MVQSERYPHIDSMRAIAALLVMVLHFAEMLRVLPYAKTHGTWLLKSTEHFDSGRIGVSLFFLISGFVIPSSLVEGYSSKAFWIRRFFRLYPMFWVSIALAIVTVWWLWGKPVSLSLVAANATMVPGPLGFVPIQGLYWTLAAELVFYLMCWLLFLAGVLRNAKVLAGIAAIFASLFYAYVNCSNRHLSGACYLVPADLLGTEWGFNLGHFSLMFLGALLRAGYERKLTTLEAVCLGAILAFWLLIHPLAGAAIYNQERAAGVLRLHGSYPIAVCLFLVLNYMLPITARPLVWLGKVSYSLYLLHPIVLYLFVRMAVLYWPTIRIGTVTWTLLLTLVTIVLSALTFRYVEQPANRLGSRLAKSLAWRLTISVRPAYTPMPRASS